MEFRYRFIRDASTLVKRHGARRVINVELRDVPALWEERAEAYIDDRTRTVLAGLCRALDYKSFFEIGTNRGRTTWSVAKSNPEATLWTLDLPSAADADLELIPSDHEFMLGEERGADFAETPEAERITQLVGDSARFDFSPWAESIDLVFIDGSHSYDYVQNDTEAALGMLAAHGTVVWDDYPHFPGIHAYLNDLAPDLDRPIIHLFDTRLAIYSRHPKLASLPD